MGAARKLDTPVPEPVERPLCLAERLAIAAHAAAVIRGAKVRKITTVDAQGKPVREITSDEMQSGLLKRQGIEIDCVGMIDCVACKRKFQRKKKRGTTLRICRRCLFQTHEMKVASCVCVDCKKKLPMPLWSWQGGDRRCNPCAVRRAVAAMTPEQKREAARKNNASMTPEQRSERSRKANASMTPEQRRAWGRKGAASRTPEQKSESARKMNASTTPEQRSYRSRKANASRTPEQRVAIGLKISAARRANAAKKAADAAT